jgi:glycosyltransferase involved in cell wall biosynthesis
MFTIILPIHNEEAMLRRTLPSIIKLKPTQVVCVFDRCYDRSETLCKRTLGSALTSIHVNEVLHENQVTALYRLGVEEASQSIVLLTQADVVLDPKIRGLIKYAGDHVCSFRNLPYLGWNTFVTFALSLAPKFRFSGVLAFPKTWFYEYDLINLESGLEWDTQIAQKVRKLGLPYRYFKTDCWNLRPYVRSRLWAIGEARRKLGRKWAGTLLYSVIRLQPEVFAAYLKSGKRGEGK